MSQSRLLLASASPRRQDLLKIIVKAPFRVEPQDVDETPLSAEKPQAYVKRVTRLKAEQALHNNPAALSLVADTIVVKGQKMLRKAQSADEAKAQMEALSGRRHQVVTAVALIRQPKKDAAPLVTQRVAKALVKVKSLSKAEIQAFVESEQWKGVAVYRLQGLFGAFVPWMQGHVSTVLGLPLFETRQMLLTAAPALLR
ncbi:MAG: Maf family protein [Holosporaceae bacterium]